MAGLHFKRKNLFLFIFLSLTLFSFSVDIVLEKGSFKYSIAIANFEECPDTLSVRKIIISDLSAYPYFIVYTKGLEKLSKSLYSLFSFSPNYNEWLKYGVEFVVYGKTTKSNDTVMANITLLDIKNKVKIFSKKYSSGKNFVRFLAHTISKDIYFYLTGKNGIFTSKVAFVSDSTSKTELFIMDWDGFNVRRITHFNHILLAPAWIDNKFILFTSYKEVNPDLYRLNIKNFKVKRISAYPLQNLGANYSPINKKIVLVLGKDGNPELYTMNINGSNLKRLTYSPRTIESHPCWSPDGNYIVFTSNRSGSPQIYIMNYKTRNIKRVSFVGHYNTEPSWSVNNKIAYTAKIGKYFHICTINPDGTERKVLTNGNYDNEQPCWSPDGEFIYYISNKTGNYRIYRMTKSGKNKICLTITKANCKYPALSQPF